MQIDEIADGIAAQFEKPYDHVFKERVKTNIITARAELIRQYIDKYNVVPQAFINQIHCEETEEADVAECCTVTLNCSVLKTCNLIPEPVRKRGMSSSFSYVGTIDGKTGFTYIDPEELEGILAERFPPKNMFYSYINGKIYLFNGLAKNIRVRGAFGDIRKIMELNDCTNSPAGCADILNIPDDLIDQIKKLVYSEMRNTPIIPIEEEVKLEENA